MKNYIIREDLAQAVLNYLAGRPYQEVFPLVAGLQGLKEASEEKAEKNLASKDK